MVLGRRFMSLLSLFLLTGLLASFMPLPASAQARTTPAPVRIILMGDSIMAAKSGYGPSFCALWQPQVTCVNAARGGRSTKSYRADGSWDQLILPVLRNRIAPDGRRYAATYVLMQFGHNDGNPKPERHTDAALDFPANLVAFSKEITALGGTPILVTPLTMRNFIDGKLLPDFIAPYAAAMKNLAMSERLPFIDLYDESQKAVQAMGPVKANHRLAGGPVPAQVLSSEASGTSIALSTISDASQQGPATAQRFDYAHLNQDQGGPFFAKMVASLLVKARPELRSYLAR